MAAESTIQDDCPYCEGEGLVCENHPDQPWLAGDDDHCGGAGMPCRCNQDQPPWQHLGVKTGWG